MNERRTLDGILPLSDSEHDVGTDESETGTDMSAARTLARKNLKSHPTPPHSHNLLDLSPVGATSHSGLSFCFGTGIGVTIAMT